MASVQGFEWFLLGLHKESKTIPSLTQKEIAEIGRRNAAVVSAVIMQSAATKSERSCK